MTNKEKIQEYIDNCDVKGLDTFLKKVSLYSQYVNILKWLENDVEDEIPYLVKHRVVIHPLSEYARQGGEEQEGLLLDEAVIYDVPYCVCVLNKTVVKVPAKSVKIID